MRGCGWILVSLVIPALACTTENVTDPESNALGATVTKDLDAFLSTQGTLCVGPGGMGCVDNGDECFLFVPPDRNFLGWFNDTDINNDGDQDLPLLFAGIDYAALADAYSEGNEPELRGTIRTRPLEDGLEEVKITLHTKGANAWVIELDPDVDDLDEIANKPTLFGHRPRDVKQGAGQALADTTLRVTIIKPVESPIPDLVRFVQGCEGPNVEQTSLQFVARAQGPLTEEFGVLEGTPGRLTINQNGVFHTNSRAENRGVGDGFPAEFIKLKVVGR